MPIASILIPAVKPTYLERAIRSALLQSLRDIEILVGDDTPDGSLAHVVERFHDSRLRYFHHGHQNAKQNAAALWRRANSPYVKWLHDDDVLLPLSVEVLVEALRAHPDSRLAFHGRVFIDDTGAVCWCPGSPIADGDTVAITRAELSRSLVGRLYNWVGELSNVMLTRDRDEAAYLFDYRGWPIDCLQDVAMYLNAAEDAPIIGVGGVYGAYRQHDGQMSNYASPYFPAILYEWELMVRGEAASKGLSRKRLVEAKERLIAHYRLHARLYPEIAPLMHGADEIDRLPAAQLLQSTRFAENLLSARTAIQARIAQACGRDSNLSRQYA
ncbi:glycosyltransferase family 2 protein [Bordetella genomosp. 9]|nr:glycosyltransferase family 2 protein [Bordetella genomosp. 9]